MVELDQARADMKVLRERLIEAGNSLNLDNMRSELAELEADMADPDF